MKRNFIFSLAVVAVLALAGCGKGGPVKISYPTDGMDFTLNQATSFTVQLSDNQYQDTTITFGDTSKIPGLQCQSAANSYASCFYSPGFGGTGFGQVQFLKITATRGDYKDIVVVTFGAGTGVGGQTQFPRAE